MHTRICRAHIHVHTRDYWYITRVGGKNNGPCFLSLLSFCFFFGGVLKGEADISLVTISLSCLGWKVGGGGEKLLLFHPSFFHLEIPAGLLEHVGERGVFFHLPISDDVWLFFFFSPLLSYTTGVVRRVERTRSNGRCIFFFPPGNIID